MGTSNDLPVSKRPGKWPLIFLSSLLLIIAFFQIMGSNEYVQVSSPLLLFSYLVLFAGMLFFLYQEFYGAVSEKVRRISFLLIGLAFLPVYLKAYYPYLEMNGDNAGYIIRALSLLQGEGFRSLHLPGAPYDATLYNFGFSLLLIPFVIISRLDFSILNLFPLISTWGALFALYFLAKRKLSGNLAIILVILLGINEEFIHFSSLVLTENVYVLFVLLALMALVKYEESPGLAIIPLLIAGVAVFFTFSVRFAGIVFLAMAPLYFLYKGHFKKAVSLGLVLLVLFGSFFIIRKSVELKHTEVFNELGSAQQETVQNKEGSQDYFSETIKNILDNPKILQNIIYTPRVLPQKILDYSYKDKAEYDKGISGHLLLFALFLVGLIGDLRRKESPISFFIIGYLVTIILFFDLDDFAVLSRYFVPAIPFFLYFAILGTRDIAAFVSAKTKDSPFVKALILLLFLFPVALVGMKTANVAILISKQGLPVAYSNFLEVGKWVKKNVSEKTIVAARKDNIFFLVSGKQSTIYYYQGGKFDRYSSYSDEMEKLTIEKLKNWNIRHIVFDTFSGDSFGKLLPLMRRYPDRFGTLICFAGKSQVVQLPPKWWMDDSILQQLGRHGAAILLSYKP